MPKGVNSYTAMVGKLDPKLETREDNTERTKGFREMTNIEPKLLGGAESRSGVRKRFFIYEWNEGGQTTQPHEFLNIDLTTEDSDGDLIDRTIFITRDRVDTATNTEYTKILIFGDLRRIYTEPNPLELEIITTDPFFNRENIGDIKHAINGHEVIFYHKDFAPRRIRRIDDQEDDDGNLQETWSLEQYPLINIPLYPFNDLIAVSNDRQYHRNQDIVFVAEKTSDNLQKNIAKPVEKQPKPEAPRPVEQTRHIEGGR